MGFQLICASLHVDLSRYVFLRGLRDLCGYPPIDVETQTLGLEKEDIWTS